MDLPKCYECHRWRWKEKLNLCPMYGVVFDIIIFRIVAGMPLIRSANPHSEDFFFFIKENTTQRGIEVERLDL